MTPAQFAAKWQATSLTEKSASQSHFLDLCVLLGQKTPTESDPSGEWYTFEKSVTKIGGDEKGFADVWKKGYFAWEYKGKKKDLAAAYKQLSAYHDDLGNPPVLVVCDLNRFEVHLKVTNTAKRIFAFDLADLAANVPTELCPEFAPLAVLRAAMENPKELYPKITPEQVTEEIAAEFGKMARNLIGRGNEPHTVARFLIRLLFCLFAEDVGLLESGMFTKTVEQLRNNPAYFRQSVSALFRAMATGGPFGATLVKHFNGGLFTDDTALDLTAADLSTLLVLARKDWKSIEPSIFGTLFERSLDPAKRSQLGAHYTSRTDIEAVVEPVLLPPLRRQWDAVRQQAEVIVLRKRRGVGDLKPDSTPTEQSRARREIADADAQLTVLLHGFADKIAAVRVLDPACGSGNFLYVSLRYLLDLEHTVIEYAYRNGLTGFFPKVSPEQMRGIELNEYAHELAPVTMWIGYLQWMRENGYSSGIEEPILRRTDMVEQRDALMAVAEDGTVSEAIWPEADYIVGNPPFLGGSKMRSELGGDYVGRLWKLFDGRVPAGADLVTYWFEKARALIADGKLQRAGLLTTNSIRFGDNRRVLDRIKETGDIFMAWGDRPWVLDGAAVRVSMVGFDDGREIVRSLNGSTVELVNADLTGREIDVTTAKVLPENKSLSFQGVMKAGAFDIDVVTAGRMLAAPMNVNGRANQDVIKVRLGGQDVVGRRSKGYVIDFGSAMPEDEASFFEMPFAYVVKNVKPEREKNNDANMRRFWWIHGRSRPEMRAAVSHLERCIVTPEVAKHRIFAWIPTETVPDKTLHVIARDDDYFFGVLHSRIHEVWSLAVCNFMGKGNDPRYNSSRTFGTFPFPYPPRTEDQDAPAVRAIADAAKKLVALRDNWLNPEGATPTELKSRTLTNLYNARPAWLDTAHRKLDEAVFAAYGWQPDLSDDAVLAALLALNRERSLASGHS